ncbi:BRE1-domain-containing protein [Histomonas meleagridis]|uniref:BRE1-domain-containing protein n=1 Tax=Histomonas meleagridis TaxID=135588 RepID=UPI00355A3F0A|nr:BRE1-domain-containing protein [Histomonas meleagridis]KAH0806865.1 BRE1-domain-containing protein [Histomonas meleagridis]
MQSLTKLTYKLSTLQGDASQFITYTKYPSPSLIKDYPDFKNELQTNSEHQKSLENAILTISPQIVKLKEQQLQISNLSKLHFSTYSDLQQTHSTLTECLKENCTAELEFLKLKLIKQAEQDYEFFNYESFTQKIISFHETESKLIESLGQDITSEQLSSYLEELQRLCNQFDYDNDQLTKKVAVKTRTEETFTEKYPKTNSEPPQRLLKSRERCKALEKKYKNQIEYLKNGFDRLTEKCAQISDESNSMFLLYDSLENSSKITEFFASSSSMDWLDSIILHLKTEIEKKKKELNDIKNQIENIRKGIVANNSNICHHQKDVCICNCGHTFCKNCIDNYVKENGENCPICKSHFAPDELIQIVW